MNLMRDRNVPDITSYRELEYPAAGKVKKRFYFNDREQPITVP
jgi:hypothetical protein